MCDPTVGVKMEMVGLLWGSTVPKRSVTLASPPVIPTGTGGPWPVTPRPKGDGVSRPPFPDTAQT